MFLAAGLRAAEPLRFSVTTDPEGSVGYITVLEQIKALPGGPGAFMVTAGDSEPLPFTRAQLDKAFGPDFLWYPVLGNHDYAPRKGEPKAGPGLQFLADYFTTRLAGKINRAPAGLGLSTYSFDAGDVHFVLVDEYAYYKVGSRDAAQGEVTPAQLQWLKADLAASKKPWKLVFGHEPAYPQPDRDYGVSRHVGACLDRNPKARDAFWAALEEAGATAYICGHTHLYSRYQPPGSRVWQIDAAIANGNAAWKYDTFLILTADAASLRIDTYRNLKEQGKFEVTDTMTLRAPAAPAAAAPGAVPPAAAPAEPAKAAAPAAM
jgi:hypothetical protein